MDHPIEFTQWKRGPLTIRASVHPARSKASPWVIFAHGFTGQRLGPDYLFVKISRALAARGCGSLRFDFCGSGESDGAFSAMTVSTMQADLLSAIAFVRRTFGAARVVLLGHSLGGAVAALCAVRGRADGLILLAPVADPQGLLQRRKDTVLKAGRNKNGFYENGPHEMSLAFVGDLRKQRPVAALSGYQGGLIVFQGDADPSIAVRESSRYVDWAQRAGVDAEMHVLKGNDHNFTTVAGVEYLCSTISQWVGGRFA